ncbi:Outer membrane protein TolC [Fodinibius roseus]|uniref:Outer membrane protein TolC n=1 Tax=Fodinibius roseus TaxID=1194090 RepID=A0A1M5GKS1_9BACT|nr:TolC family protein [Fodinibius roseus]SHG04131.1 Outer membrane protein TolC [Fodinibius roseus]
MTAGHFLKHCPAVIVEELRNRYIFSYYQKRKAMFAQKVRMMMRRTMGLLAALLLCGGTFSAQAQQPDSTDRTTFEQIRGQPQAVSVDQAIQIALANNTEIKRSLLSVRDADQQVRTAWSNVLPEVTSSANYTRNLEVPVNFIPEVVFDPEGDPDTLVPVAFGTDNNWQGGFTVSQTLFNGQAFVGVSTSSLYKAAQTEGMRATAQGIVTQTRMAYYQVLIAREQVRLQQSRLNRVEENLEDTRTMYEQGMVDEYAVIQLEVQLENIRPELTSAEFSKREAVRNLLDTMGLPVSLGLEVEGDLSRFDIRSESVEHGENRALKEVDRMTPLSMESDSMLLRRAFDYRGDLRMLDIRQQLQEKRIQAEKSKYLPSVTASYNLQWSAAQAGTPVFFGSEQQRARSQTFMIGLQLPLFQGFSRDAAIQQAQIQQKDLQLQEYQAKRTAESELTAAEEGIREAFQVEQARKRALEQAQIGYERALKRYQNGLGSQQEVNDAELQLREAETGYAQTVFNYLSAKAQYDQAVGQVPYVEEDTDAIRKNIELE